MKLEKVDFDQLKKMAVLLNTATYKDAEEKDVLFYTGKKLKTIAISKEDLAKNFDAAIKSISDEIVNDLPEAIIDFYNEFFGSEDPAPAAAPAAKPADAKKAEKPAKEKKEKAEKPPKEKKAPKEKKPPVELSVFGHKVGSQAAALDDLINTGKSISLDELSKKSGRSALGVKSHVKHLQTSRGLKIEEKEGMYKLVK